MYRLDLCAAETPFICTLCRFIADLQMRAYVIDLLLCCAHDSPSKAYYKCRKTRHSDCVC